MTDNIVLWTGKVPADALDIIRGRILRLTKRAVRQGFPVPSLSTGATTSLVTDEVRNTSIEYIEATISAPGRLALGDYEFVGVIAELADGSPFVTFAPGVERTDDTFATVNYCDHCRTTRQRNDTYIVRNLADGVTTQVGSSCIMDFTGHTPGAIVGWLSAINELNLTDEVAGWTRNATQFYRPEVIVMLASRVVAAVGYCSRQKAYDERRLATGDIVREFLTETRSVELRRLNEDYPDSKAADELYLSTMSAIEAKVDQPASSDWEADIVRLASSKGVQWRHVGILTSAVIFGQRAREVRLAPVKGESAFIGEKGQRLDFTDVKVNFKRAFESDYGSGFVIRMTVNDSDDLLWFGSGIAADTIEEGSTISFRATVKNHEHDQRTDRPTTVLSRLTPKEE